MRLVNPLKIFPLLALFLGACDLTQFDPSPHRNRYEQERIVSEQKRVELTDDGQLAKKPETPDADKKPEAPQAP